MAKNQVSVSLRGLGELRKKLQDLGGRKAGAIQRKAVNAGGREVLQVMRVLAPKDSGATRKSLAVKVKGYRQSGIFVAIVGPRSDYVKSVRVGKKVIFRRPSKTAHLLERGTRRSRAEPFVGPAIQAAQVRALEAMEQKAREELASL